MPHDRAVVDLAQADVDGALDERGRAELARALLADRELRALHADLKRVAAALEAIEPVEPPPGFAADLLAALPHRTARGGGAGWRSGRWLRAAMLAGAVLAGAIVVAVVEGLRPPASDVAGTLTDGRASRPLDTVQLAGGPVSGVVRLMRDGSGLSIALDVHASEPVDVLVVSGEHTLKIEGAGTRSGDGRQGEVALPGVGSDAGTINLTFLIGGVEVGWATLRVPAGH
jgi:hypothetical protein